MSWQHEIIEYIWSVSVVHQFRLKCLKNYFCQIAKNRKSLELPETLWIKEVIRAFIPQ